MFSHENQPASFLIAHFQKHFQDSVTVARTSVTTGHRRPATGREDTAPSGFKCFCILELGAPARNFVVTHSPTDAPPYVCLIRGPWAEQNDERQQGTWGLPRMKEGASKKSNAQGCSQIPGFRWLYPTCQGLLSIVHILFIIHQRKLCSKTTASAEGMHAQGRRHN